MVLDLYKRRPTRIVNVGNVAVGGNNPIRIQSMTISDTCDTAGVVREIKALVRAGCEIVRITVPTQRDCDNLPNIRAALKSAHIKVPLVADIHFTPSVAMKVVDYVEKVRINPGNFADKKLFKKFEISDDEYAGELIRIEEKFAPLVLKCKDLGISMRIGTNHGSLSDRIMNRYGDTPLGMVESALEFLRIAVKLDYHDIIFSMKASNTQVMVTAYREMARQLAASGWDYPFHLGVTEAGEGEDGRVKSAIGIGTLLEEGLGDTIRVSLTEDSEHEIPVATMLASPANQKIALAGWRQEVGQKRVLPQHLEFLDRLEFATSYQRRASRLITIGNLSHGRTEKVRVWTRLAVGRHLAVGRLEEFLSAQRTEHPFEGVEIEAAAMDAGLVAALKASGTAVSSETAVAAISSDLNALSACADRADKLVWRIERTDVDLGQIASVLPRLRAPHAVLEFCLDTKGVDVATQDFTACMARIVTALKHADFSQFAFSLIARNGLTDYRILARVLADLGCDAPIHIRYVADRLPAQLDGSVLIGGLLIDGIGDSIQIDDDASTFADTLRLSYNILQGSRVRISKTEYISCPSCGRTQFNIQETTDKIRRVTTHLKGVKIAVMGCIVNGPGEMADADFGYVGTGTKRISLYVGKECVERNIPEEFAVQKLLDLVKSNGRWVEPPAA